MFLQEVPLQSVPVMLTTEMGASPNIGGVDSKMIETYETSTFYKESMESKFQETREVFNSVRGLPGNFLRPGGTLGTLALLEHVALSDTLLKGYYAQVQYSPHKHHCLM